MMFKRAVDVTGALSGLLLCFPVFIILPVLIKLDSPGPVFFRQLRVGFNRRRSDRRSMEIPAARDRRSNDRRQNNLYGKPFMIYKFRTMRQDAEKHSGPVWASKNDPRITPLGRFLRASRLDEIPQLINVLKGEMSLVGPRPERPYFIEKLRTQIDFYESRMNVKPGITGLAQVEHGYDQDIDDVRKKVNFDLEYIRRWNVYHDFKIMLKTVVVMVGGRGM
ncbi:MAG: sugar transferase [candidate division Zixibacteria bacterium]|nr:sugar transferase [candidate division Zixibacteria bacterium]